MPLIRRASSEDALKLTRIVRESNAYSGKYRNIVENLEVTPAQIERDLIYVYEIEHQIAGFYSVISKPDEAELDLLFVDNLYLGHGIGQALFQHMIAQAQQLGVHQVEIIAHPPAQAFYTKMGAVVVGEKPPSGRVTWTRPRMRVLIPSTA